MLRIKLTKHAPVNSLSFQGEFDMKTFRRLVNIIIVYDSMESYIR